MRARDRLGRPLPAGSRDELPEREDPERLALSIAEAIERAVALFDAERFFEAHEFFEYVWKSPGTPAGERRFWRGVTQVAVGCCHLQRGNRRGAVAVLERARRNLDGYPDEHGGVDARGLRAFAATLEREPRAELSAFPRARPGSR